MGMEGDAMILTLREIVRTLYGDAPMADQRRRLTIVTAAYHDADGNEYRKVFEAYGYPEIPRQGTHKEINSKRKQWG